MARPRTPNIAIIGAGAGGLATGIRLKKAGIETFTIFEQSDGVGGTWRDNTYPGAQCDVQSHFYSFSFALNPYWSQTYADQPEILDYFERCADVYGLRPHLRCGTPIETAAWDDESRGWRLRTRAGEEITADVVVSALGMLNVPAYPDIEGLADFAGPVFHSARWDHSVDLRDRRVAVIGTGASAVQLVPPVAEQASHLSVFQRSPAWILPKPLRPYRDEEIRRFRHVPLAARRERWKYFWMFERVSSFKVADPETQAREGFAKEWMATAIADDDLRAKLTPDFPFGCTRILLTNDYYPALQRPDVDLVTEPILRVTDRAVVTADGREHAVDVIILATGFKATAHLSAVDFRGRGGRRLRDEWKDGGAAAYLGTTIPGYPNLFVLYGPNTNQGGNSIIFIIEAQVHYVMRALARIRRRGNGVMEVRTGVARRYNRRIANALRGTVWDGGCHNYFKDASGRITTQYPHRALWFWLRTRAVNPFAYRTSRRARVRSGPAG